MCIIGLGGTDMTGTVRARCTLEFKQEAVREAAVKLKERTLTNLYNQRPQWLFDAHATLDRVAAAAYGWPEDIGTDEALARLLTLNPERAAAGR
jgi:hypothetical protein